MIRDLPPSDPEFGKAVPCSCKTDELIEKRLRDLNALASSSGIVHLTFDAFVTQGQAPFISENLRTAYDTCMEFAIDPKGWLFITGTYGCGKTHLAAAIANFRVAHGHRALFAVTPDLLDHIRTSYNPDSEETYDNIFENLKSTPLLVLDDFGAQSATPWAQEKLFQLLNHRYNASLPTVVTTNQRLDEIEPRIRSRLSDINLVTRVAIVAPDYRTGGAYGQSNQNQIGLYGAMTFETFLENRQDLTPEERENLRIVKAQCMKYAEDAHKFLILSGNHGTGKTHLAAAIANVQLLSGRSDTVFVNTVEYLDYLRSSFGQQAGESFARRFDDVKNARLLVLDGLRLEGASEWSKEKLLQIMEYRYVAGLPTVITTTRSGNNLDPWLKARALDDSKTVFCVIKTDVPFRGSKSLPIVRGRQK